MRAPGDAGEGGSCLRSSGQDGTQGQGQGQGPASSAASPCSGRARGSTATTRAGSGGSPTPSWLSPVATACGEYPPSPGGPKGGLGGGAAPLCNLSPPLSLCSGVFSDGRATYLIEPQVGVEHGQVSGGTGTRHVSASVSPLQRYRSGCGSGTALGTQGRGGPPSTLSRPRVAVTLVSPWQGLRPHVIQRVPSCAGPGEPLHRAGARPRGLVTVAPVAPCPVPHQLCPFPPGCLFPALNQPIAGGLPKLRRRRQVSRDNGGRGAGDKDA